MKYSFKIDQINSIEWGFNPSEALLFAYLFELPSWAEYWISNGKIFYHASRNKVVLDAPLVSDKPDTIYRLFISLEKKGVLEYEKNGRKDGICFTDKGKLWNSEKNPTLIENSENFPTELGKKSEKTRKKIRENSENFPTNNLISNNSINTISLKDNSENEFSTVLVEEDEELKIEVHHIDDYFDDEPKEKEKKVAPKKEKETPAQDFDFVHEVVTYLNEKNKFQGLSFRPNGKQTQAVIFARKNLDKWTLDDFKTVIDFKVHEWAKSDKMRHLLCPSTLFRACYAETYLTTAKAWKDKPNVTAQKTIIPLYREEGYSKSNVLF
jgi:uncharacterized phage protein (TIGR02220 family)